MPGSDYRFNSVEFFFYPRDCIFSGCIPEDCVNYISFCANHGSKVSSLASEVSRPLHNDKSLAAFVLKAMKVVYYDEKVKEVGLGRFLQLNTQEQYNCGVVKHNEFNSEIPFRKSSDNSVEFYYGINDTVVGSQKFYIRQTSFQDFVDKMTFIEHANPGMQAIAVKDVCGSLARFVFSSQSPLDIICVFVYHGTKISSLIPQIRNRLYGISQKASSNNYLLKELATFFPKKKK
jgi:hypothetical protein